MEGDPLPRPAPPHLPHSPTYITPSLVFSAASVTPCLVFSTAPTTPSLAMEKPFLKTSMVAARMGPGCCKLWTGVLPQPLSLLPLPLIDVDEILMLWLLAGAQPAQGRVGAGRAGWREGMPHRDTRVQGPSPYWLNSTLLTPVVPGEGECAGDWTYPNLSLHLICPWKALVVSCPGSCMQKKSALADASVS